MTHPTSQAPASDSLHAADSGPRTTLRAVALIIACVALLGGCSLLGGRKQAPTVYAPRPVVQADAAWPRVPWQLVIAPPQAARPYDSIRIAVRPTPQELQVYKGAQWAQRPVEMLERAVLRTLEDSERLPAVARSGAGVNADVRLVLDIRRFEADYAGAATPSAVIEVSAKLLGAEDRDVLSSRTFLKSTPANDTAVPSIVDAFQRSLEAVTRDIAGWTLSSGRAASTRR